MTNAVRIVGVALAAGLCLATSESVDEVESVTPLPGETAVPLDTVPRLGLSSNVDFDAAAVTLVNGAGAAVAGQARQADRGIEFVPLAPLAPDDDYTFTVVGLLEGFFYVDPVANSSVTLGMDTAPDRVAIDFSTRSGARVRYARRAARSPTVMASFSQEMAPLSLSVTTVSVIADGVERDAQLVLYRGGPLHEVEVTLFDPTVESLELVFGDGVEAADGTPIDAPLVVPVTP